MLSKFILDNWILILAAITSGTLLFLPALRRGAGGGVSVPEAVLLINREKAVLVDVCEPAEYANGHAAGARNVPLGQLQSSRDLPSNKSLPVVLVCQSGGRSSRAVRILQGMGYASAHTLTGGLRAWREANLPVEKA